MYFCVYTGLNELLNKSRCVPIIYSNGRHWARSGLGQASGGLQHSRTWYQSPALMWPAVLVFWSPWRKNKRQAVHSGDPEFLSWRRRQIKRKQ